MKQALAALLFFFILSASYAQNLYQPPLFNDPQRLQKIEKTFPVIDRLFQDYARRMHITGAVWGLLVDDRLVHSGSFGYTDAENKIPVSATSVFRIASMTKSFTAMAILKLRDEGLLGLDDAAVQYIPELKNLRYLTTDSREITIRDLLTHAAGFPEDNPWGDRQLADSEEELTALIKKGFSLSTSAGTAYEYSNLGFALLGRIITNISKLPYDRYIDEQILKPLGMKQSFWDWRQVPAKQLVKGYRRVGDGWREEAQLPHGSWGAMGGLLTSLEDFARYVALHQQAWPPHSGPEGGPLKRSSLREMHQPWNFAALMPNYRYPSGRFCASAAAYGYGLRWFKDCEDRTMIGHSGGLPGFGSNWQFLPDYGLAVISFANRTYAPMTAINLQVIDTVIRLAGLQPAALPPSPIFKQRMQELIRLLPHWKDAEASGIFAENFFKDYFIDSLKKEAGQIFNEAGPIKSVGEIKTLNQLRGSFYLIGENKNIEVWFTLSPEIPATIQEYRIRLVPR